MEHFIVQVITSAGVNTLITAALIFLTKTWLSERIKNAIKSEYDQKLETHKAHLKAESDVAIEQLRSQLSIVATEHQVRFANLHEKRADVVAETYSRLTKLLSCLKEYVKIYEMEGDPPKEQRRTLAFEAINAFREYYDINKLFLPAPTANQLDNFASQLVRAFNDFVIKVEGRRSQSPEDHWMEIFTRVADEIPKALRELEAAFRRILGEEG